MTDKLTPLREQIDAIDAQILDLLNRRALIAQEVGHVKAETQAPVFRPEREAQVLRGVAERNPGPMGDREVQTIFREIMSSCRSLEKRVTVAYLGPAGTFSEQAVYQQFGSAVEGLALSAAHAAIAGAVLADYLNGFALAGLPASHRSLVEGVDFLYRGLAA